MGLSVLFSRFNAGVSHTLQVWLIVQREENLIFIVQQKQGVPLIQGVLTCFGIRILKGIRVGC